MFFLLYRQKEIDKIIEGNDRNYFIDKLTCEIMENKPLTSEPGKFIDVFSFSGEAGHNEDTFHIP